MLGLTGGAPPLGVFCLLSAVVLYWAALVRFPPVAFARNHHVYASLGLALMLAGSVLLLPRSAAAVLWCGLSVAAMFTSARTARSTLAIHGAVYLVAGATISGLLNYCRLAMTGAVPPGEPSPVSWILAAAAALAYLACSSAPTGRWTRLLAASLVALAVSAFLVAFIAHFAAAGPNAPWLPTVRTLVVCGVALSLAVASTRFRPAFTYDAEGPELSVDEHGALRSRRIELTWISYAAMALLAVKIFVEDFHDSPPAALAVSLLCYGGVLIFGPRLTRSRTPPAAKQESAAQPEKQLKSAASKGH
jgi:hypothetical protein